MGECQTLESLKCHKKHSNLIPQAMMKLPSFPGRKELRSDLCLGKLTAAAADKEEQARLEVGH